MQRLRKAGKQVVAFSQGMSQSQYLLAAQADELYLDPDGYGIILEGLSGYRPYFRQGLQDKLLGQVQLALLGQRYLNDGGSITLISGILGTEPIRNGASATAVNAAIEGFVAAAAIELPRGLRINAISPTVLTESMGTYGPFFPGFEPVPAERAALAYQRSVEGAQTGRVYRVHP